MSLSALFSALLAAALLAGCVKWGEAEETTGGPTTVAGQVLEADRQVAVPRPPQVQVWGRAQATGSLLGGAAYAPVGDPQPTDGQGRFAFSFQAEGGHQYVLRAAEGGLGYYTDWGLAPALQGGRKNENLRLPVYAPAWIRLDLVDEPPQSRVWIDVSGGGGGGTYLALPRDTTLYFYYLTGTGKESFVWWSISETGQPKKEESRTFIQMPLDTQRVRVAF